MGRSLRWFVVACAVAGVLSAVGMSTAWGAPLPRENESIAPWFLPLQENVDGVPAPGLVHKDVANASAILAASPTAYLANKSKGSVNDGEDGFINGTATGASNPGSGLNGTYSPIYRWLAKAQDGAGAMIANLQPGDTLVMAAVVANVSSASVARLQSGALQANPAEYTAFLQGVTADFYKPYVAPGKTLFSATYTDVYPSSATAVTTNVKDATLVVFLWDGSTLGTAAPSRENPALLVVPATVTTTGQTGDLDGLRACVQLVGGRNAYSNYVGFDVDGPKFVEAKIAGVVGPDGHSVGFVGQPVKQTGFITIPTNAVSEIRSGDTLIVDATFTTQITLDGEPDVYFGPSGTDRLIDAVATYITDGATKAADGNFAAAFLRQENDIDVKAFSTILPAAIPVDAPGTELKTGNGYAQTTPPFPSGKGENGVWLGTVGGAGQSLPITSSDWAADPVVMRATFVVTNASTVAGAKGMLDIGNNALPIHFIVGDELGLHHSNQYSLGFGAGQAPLTFNAPAIGNISNATVAQVTGYVDTRPPVIVRSVLTAPNHPFAKGGEGAVGSSARGIVGPASGSNIAALQIDFTLEEDPQATLERAYTISYAAFDLNNSNAAVPLAASSYTAIDSLAGSSQKIFGASSTDFITVSPAILNNNLNAGVVVTVTDDARNAVSFDSKSPVVPPDTTWTAGGISGIPRPSTVVVDAASPAILAATLYVTRNVSDQGPIGNQISNAEVMDLLKEPAVGSNAYAGGTVLGATLGSPGSTFQIQIDFEPDRTGNSPDRALATYPHDGANSSLRNTFSFTSPGAPNILGINKPGGLFTAKVTIPAFNYVLPNVVASASAVNGIASVTMQGIVPARTAWAEPYRTIASATGLPYVTAVVEICDRPYNYDQADGNLYRLTRYWDDQPTPDPVSIPACTAGIVIDTTSPLVLNQKGTSAQIPSATTPFGTNGYLLAVIDPAEYVGCDQRYGVQLNSGKTIFSASRQHDHGTELKAGDYLIVEATITGTIPTIANDDGTADYDFFWPRLVSPPDTDDTALDRVPALISADFTDFIADATAEIPDASITISALAASIYDATAGDVILVTFVHRITGDNAPSEFSAARIRGVTVNVFDVAGNVSSVGLYGATADFKQPNVNITDFKLNGTSVASLPTDTTVSIGDRMDVYAEILAGAGCPKVSEIWADFRSFGLCMYKHNQGAITGPPGYSVTISYRDGANRLQTTTADDLSTGTSIADATILYATFSYTNLADNNYAIPTKSGKVIVSATNTASRAKSSQTTPAIGVDLNAPDIGAPILEQKTKRVSADSLDDDWVRNGDTMTLYTDITGDNADKQGRPDGADPSKLVTIFPTANLSSFGGGIAVEPTYRYWKADTKVLRASWEFTVDSTGKSNGILGPFSAVVSATDAVENAATPNTAADTFFIENSAPSYPSNIVVDVSNEINLVGGSNGTRNAPYRVTSGTETVKAGDTVYVSATIALNDDPSKVTVNTSDITLTAPSIYGGGAAPTPSWRQGSSNIKAYWDVLVSPTVPTLIPSGPASTARQFVVTARDTAGLSGESVAPATVEVDNTPPNATLETRVFVAENAANTSRRGAELTNETVITGQGGAAVMVGPATFEAILTVTYDGNPDGPDRNDFPGRALANWGVGNMTDTLARLGLTDLTGGDIPKPDFYKITGLGPIVTSASSTADIARSTNTTVTYYYYKIDPPRTNEEIAELASNPALLSAVPRSGFTVARDAAASKVAAKLIGYASDDIGNVTPTATIVQSAGAGDYASIFSIELDNTAPAFAQYKSQYGKVKYATYTVTQTDNVGFNPYLPRLSAGDVVAVTFAVKDDVNNTTPLTASFDLGGFYEPANTPSATLVGVANSPDAAGAFGSGTAKFIYTISNIVPPAAGQTAEGCFSFVVGTTTSNEIDAADGGWTDSEMPGAEIVLDATDAIGLNLSSIQPGWCKDVESVTLEVDNQPPLFVAQTVVKPDGTPLSSKMISEDSDSKADVHVAVRQPGSTVWQILDPPSVMSISQDPANPTLIRATATVYSDSLASFTTNLVTTFNSDGNTRLQNLVTSIENTGTHRYTLNATAAIAPDAKPMQPQVVKFTAVDNLGNSETSKDANLLGINAQGVFLLEGILYVNGVNVDEAGGGAAQTGSSAPDRLLPGAGVDELRPGDEIKYVATFGNDSGAPDVMTADFSAFYPPILKRFVTYLVPSATQAGSGNTTIATWEYATVETITATGAYAHFASIWINDTTTFGRKDDSGNANYPPGRQGFGNHLLSGAVRIAPMGADQAPVPLGQAVIGNGKIAVQNVWNLSDLSAKPPAQATGTQPAKAATIVVTATDYDSLFPATTAGSDGLILDTQPPEVNITLTPAAPPAFRTAGDGHPFNRVTRGDTLLVAADIVNPNVLRTGDDDWLAGPGSNLNNVVVAADVSGFGGSSALPFPITSTYTQGGLTHFLSTQTVTVGDTVGTTDASQRTVVNITWTGHDDVNNNMVEVIHEQPVAVDNFPPSIFRGSLGVELRSGTATYGEGASQIVVTTPGSKLGRTGWKIAPGSILRVSAVVGDTLDDPLGFLSNNRISLSLSGSPVPPSATVTLQNDLATISQTNLSAPFDVELARGADLDTTLGFGFTVSVTDVVGNNATETGIGSFDVNGRPIIRTYASTVPTRLHDQAVSAGEGVAINADEILTLSVVATDLGNIAAMDVTQTPADALGSTLVWQTSLSGGNGTATITVTPDVPTYGVGPAEPFAVEASATDNDGLTAFVTPGINVAINDIPLFSPVFQAAFDGTTQELTSTDIGRLSTAGADIRQVTISEGDILKVTLEARDMSAVPANLTLVATGTAISSSATVANATLNGVHVLNAASDPAVAFVQSGSIEFIFEPGFKAIPFGSDAQKATFTLRAYVADEAQIALGTQKDYVDILIDVLPQAMEPVVEVVDVSLFNANETLSTALGAVSAAEVQETSKVVVTATGRDLGGEPVTLEFTSNTAIPFTTEIDAAAADTTTNAQLEMTPGLFDADAGVGEGYVDSANDPTTITVTGTNTSGLDATDQVVLDIVNHSMPPILTVATSQDGPDIGAGITINAAVTPSLKLYITARDSDAELVIVDVNGTPLDDAVTVAGQSTGTYTFNVPTGLLVNTTYNLVVRGIDGGFQITRRTVSVTVLVGNQAPTLALSPTEVTVAPNAQTTIVATGTDLDGDALTFGATVAPAGIGTVAVGTVTQSGNVSTVNIVFTAGSAEGEATVTVTATDPSTASDTKVATITIEISPQAPDEMILAQGQGGFTLTKRNFMNDAGQWRFTPFSGFQALTPSFAASIGTPRDRFTNVAVADFNHDGKMDILTGFGPGGKAGAQPSIILIWEQYPDKAPTVISTRGAFAKDATNAAYRNPQGHINVAAGDFVGEDLPLVIAAQGIGGSNQIRVFQLGNLRVANGINKGTFSDRGTFRAWPGAGTAALWGNTSGGVSVAAGDLDGDGIDELVVGQLNGSEVGGYKPETYIQVLKLARNASGTVVVDKYSTPIHAFDDVAQYGLGGVNLAIGDVNGDGKNDIVVASAGNPDATAKNLIRAFDMVVAGSDISLQPIMPARSVMAAAANPSGALSIAVGNLDRLTGDEILVGTQATLNVNLETGAVTAANLPPKILVRGVKLNFVDGAYSNFTEVRPPFEPFAGTALPTSNSVFLGFYPAQD